MGQRAETVVFDQNGRALGRRAMQTRELLLEATKQLLALRSIRDISVVDIAREADTSPATFYLYFKDREDAVLRLSERVSEELPVTLATIDDNWAGEEGLENARRVVRAFLEMWDKHRAILMARNIIADEGDVRFHRVRRNTMAPVIGRIAKAVTESQRAGRIDASIHPAAMAIGLVAMVERMATYNLDLTRIDVSREILVETLARMLQNALAQP